MSIVLEEITIEKFRNVKPGTTLRFSDKFNVLLGKNGTGKTTLLELISCVLRGEYDFPSEDVALSYVFRTNVGFLKGEVLSLSSSQEFKYKQIENFAVLDSSGRELTFSSSPNDNRYLVRRSGDEHELVSFPVRELSRHYTHNEISNIRAVGGEFDPFFDICVQSTAHVTSRFDESLDFFEFLTASHSHVSERNLFFRIKPNVFDSINPEIRYMSELDESILPFLINCLESQSRPYQGLSNIRIFGQSVPFLKMYSKLIGLFELYLRFDILERSVNEGRIDLLLGNPTYECFKKNGSSFTHERLSYGQKRLLAFITYLSNNPRFVIADELINGFHHEWIDFCMGELETRQSFLTSQNPTLLDHLYFESEEEAASSFVLCELEEDDGGNETVVWRQMDDREARRFYKAYGAGIQHVSEVLKSKQLW